ncbi:MAG: TolC family protein, partial [Thermodesulfobacteriota bacterium]
ALTLEECIQLALKNRPELEMATLDILNAEYQIKEANSYYYPHLNVTAGYTRFNRPETFDFNVDITEFLNSLSRSGIPIPSSVPRSLAQQVEIGKTNWFSVSVDLNQPIYTFGRIEEGVNQARIGRSIAVNQKEKKREEIIFEVTKGYCQFILAKEIHQLMKEAEARAGVVASMVKIGYETSIPEKEDKGTTRLDYLKAENFHSEIKARLSEAGKNAKLAELGLKMAMGIITEQPLSLAEVSLQSMPMISSNPGEVKEKVRGGNVDLKNLDLGVQLFDSRRRATKKEYFPKIGVQGQYTGPEDRFGTPNVFYAGIGITLPLFDGFSTRAKVSQAETQFHKANGQKMLLESALSIQVDHLYSTLTELKERVNILQGAIKDAQERAQLAADGYAAGITEYDELLLAQRTEFEMRSAYLQGLYLYQTTKSEMEFISGGT